MATDARTYLATMVLNEQRVVTYRALSRALKIHHNLAKRLIYEFHAQQTTRKKGSVHATYLVGGTRKIFAPTGHNGIDTGGVEDNGMQSSPFMSSAVSHQAAKDQSVPLRSIVLVGEQDLGSRLPHGSSWAGTKSQLELINFIHVYSVEPSPLKDLQTLSEGDREIADRYRNEDPLIIGKEYGIIQNTGVRRRTGPRPVLPAKRTVTSSKSSSRLVEKVESVKSQATEQEPEARVSGPTNSSEDPDARKAAEVPPGKSQKRDRISNGRNPSLQRNQSDIFKSFSKSRTAPKKENADSSLAASATASVIDSPGSSAHEDEPMEDLSENEQADDMAIRTGNRDTSKINLKAQREEKLRKMMDDDDELMVEAEDTPSRNKDDEDLPDTKGGLTEDAIQPQAVSSGVRRRGRRRVTRKKTVKDEEGYLVTREEQAWESFSEDEPEVYKGKAQLPSSSSAGQGKKSIKKPGQGNIMSFFSNK